MSGPPERKGNVAPVVGVLGAVCSGKSTVARLMAEQGFELVDADRIGHEVLEQPQVKKQLRDSFGDHMFNADGTLNRDELGRCVFRCASCLERLNSIVHPLILDEIARKIRRVRRGAAARPIVLDAALLMEKNLNEQYCDLLVFVDAPEEARKARARCQRGWSAAELSRRHAAQMAPELKRRQADLVIDNSGAERELRAAVSVLVSRIRKRFYCAGAGR